MVFALASTFETGFSASPVMTNWPRIMRNTILLRVYFMWSVKPEPKAICNNELFIFGLFCHLLVVVVVFFLCVACSLWNVCNIFRLRATPWSALHKTDLPNEISHLQIFQLHGKKLRMFLMFHRNEPVKKFNKWTKEINMANKRTSQSGFAMECLVLFSTGKMLKVWFGWIQRDRPTWQSTLPKSVNGFFFHVLSLSLSLCSAL